MLFCPDQFLGAHVRRVTGRKNMHIWAGECHVHAGINGDELTEQARATPMPNCSCTPNAVAPLRRCTSPAKAPFPRTG